MFFITLKFDEWLHCIVAKMPVKGWLGDWKTVYLNFVVDNFLWDQMVKHIAALWTVARGLEGISQCWSMPSAKKKNEEWPSENGFDKQNNNDVICYFHMSYNALSTVVYFIEFVTY